MQHDTLRSSVHYSSNSQYLSPPPSAQVLSPPSRISSISPISQPRSPSGAGSVMPTRHIFETTNMFHNISNGSVRKRPRQASDSPSNIPDPQVLVDWVCHPVHDTVVHFSGCGVCHAYLNHLADAEQEPSFQNAVKVRDRQRDAYFHDGVSEGRRRQRDDDDYVYQDRERYRKERNDALEAISRYRIDSHDSREELEVVVGHLRASQAECDRLRQRVEMLTKESSDLANRLQANHTASQNFVVDDTPSKLEFSPNPSVASPKNLNESPDIPEPTRAPTSYAAVASSRAPSAAQTTSAIGQRVVHVPSRPTAVVTAPKPVAAATTVSLNPKNIRQLNALMAAAHQPGNEAALSRVKVLCSEAHATPRELKTELQKVLLSSWRNPVPGGGAFASAPTPTPQLRTPVRPGVQSSSIIKMNPRVDDPVEVWYEYLCTHQASWPRGVRRDARNRPVLADLKASRIVARLRPETDPQGKSAPRAEFMSCVVDLFSTPGAYHNCVQMNNFRVAPATTVRPYRGPIAVTIEDVVRHFADCGVTFETATRELEPWAQNHRAESVSS